MPDAPAGAQASRSRWRTAWSAFVEPRPDGLPNARALAVPLALLAAVLVALVALGVTGTSTGAVHSLISDEADPDLLVGHPQPIRSDEWFVQTSWTISQVEQDLPVRNETFPGGMDATVQHDLPTRDWSTGFRPHLLGFLFLPLDQAMALKWWLPGFAMIGAAFFFIMTLLPRRPVLAMTLATGFFFSSFFQWWYLSITFYPPAWAFLVMGSIVWCLRSPRGPGRWILAGLLAYVTVALGTGIYVPFIVPVVLVALGFGVGAIASRELADAPFRTRVVRVLPVLVAGAAGGAGLAVWALTRWSTIQGFTSTVYPGERLQPVGDGGAQELGALFAGFLSHTLERTQGQPFGMNSSEAATFLLPGVLLLPVVCWLIVSRLRRKSGPDWILIGVAASGLVMFAFLFLPGWDAISHLLFLDRTTYGRMRLGFGLLSVVMLVLVCWRLDGRRERPPIWIGAASVALGLLSMLGVLALAGSRMDLAALIDGSRRSLALTIGLGLLLLAGVWFFARGRSMTGAVLLLVCLVVPGVTVNPLYRGVLDLRETATVAEIERLSAEDPGEWVGIATTPLPTMMLVEAGVPSFNGFQSSPSAEMWDEIDPLNTHEAIWNRLANVSWVVGEGEPAPRNPAPDQIQLTFDSCGQFARDNVTWVLTEVPIDQSCLRETAVIEEGPSTMRIYQVVDGG